MDGWRVAAWQNKTGPERESSEMEFPKPRESKSLRGSPSTAGAKRLEGGDDDNKPSKRSHAGMQACRECDTLHSPLCVHPCLNSFTRQNVPPPKIPILRVAACSCNTWKGGGGMTRQHGTPREFHRRMVDPRNRT